MQKWTTPILAISLIFVVALLALFAMGVFDGEGRGVVSDVEYEWGGFSFSGGVKDGLFSGDGAINLQDGDVFEGGFDEGRFSGNGAYYSSGAMGTDAWYFSGEFKNGQTDSGAFYFSDGSNIVISRDGLVATIASLSWQYSGGFDEYGSTGIGSFTFEDGSVYTGGFLNGLADGEGEYKDSEGRIIYSGSFRNGAFDGQGVYFSPEGWTYSGSFKDGLFDGEGSVSDGGISVSGVWSQGVQISR